MPTQACRSENLRQAVEVQITGSLLIFDVTDPLAERANRSRRWLRNIRICDGLSARAMCVYAFTHFGVPYVVSIQMPRQSTTGRGGWPGREAILSRTVSEALRVAGGHPPGAHGHGADGH